MAEMASISLSPESYMNLGGVPSSFDGRTAMERLAVLYARLLYPPEPLLAAM